MHIRSGLWFDGLATSGITRKRSMSATFAMSLSKGKESGVPKPPSAVPTFWATEHPLAISRNELERH
jgi:hypothetical protein